MSGYTIILPGGGNPQQPNQNQPQQQQIPMGANNIPTELFIEQMAAQTRNINAMARYNESVILLNGMGEIRAALNIPSITDGDTGVSERPPLKPMFEPEQVTKLQNAYLALSERYHKFAHHMMKNELNIGVKDESKPE